MNPKHFLALDFETYWDREGYGLRQLSTPEYIFHPKFEVLLLAVQDSSWPAPKILLPDQIAPFLAQYPVEDTIAVAHNMLFDGAILAWKYNWVPGLLQDTLGMVRAVRDFRSNSLAAVTKELFGDTDAKGDTVHKVAGMRTQDIKNAGLWPDFCTYAMNDTRLCLQIYKRLFRDLPAQEKQIQDLVLRCALQPVLQIDRVLLREHLAEIRDRKAQLLKACGFEKASLMSTAQFEMALMNLGVEVEYKTSATGRQVPAFAKTDSFMSSLVEYQEADDATNVKVQTLAMARLEHKSTIEETRCERLVNIADLPWPNSDCKYPDCDGGPATGYCHNSCRTHSPMLPVALKYGGAHTHRLSGEWKLNLQNLPRDKSKSKLRTAIIAPKGYKIVTADLAQIEARLVASFCDQRDLLELFRHNKDVYAEFGTRLFGQPVSRATVDMRFIAKTAILGLGYGCGADRFYRMTTALSRQYGIELEGVFDESVAQHTVDLYRHTFRNISKMWKTLDRHIDRRLRNGTPGLNQLGPITLATQQILLPGGLKLNYKDEKLQQVYGAKLLENIVQALARIVVMDAAVRLSKVGLRFVMQSHDELVFAVMDAFVEDAKIIIEREMIKPPKWMPGLPLAVEIGVGDNYGAAK